MPDLDLEPKDYRAQPIKGEKVFASGGLMRIGFVAFAILVFFVLRGPLLALSDWLWSLWH